MSVREPQTTVLAHELRETLGRLIRRLRAEPGVPVGRLNVLGRLDRCGSASISELAAAEHMRPQSMAPIVHDLETSGLVSRRPDPADGRRAVVELTPEGLNQLQATRDTRETWLTGVLEREFAAQERDQIREVLVLLNRLADA